MKSRKIKATALLTALLTLTAIVFAGCGSQNAGAQNNTTAASTAVAAAAGTGTAGDSSAASSAVSTSGEKKKIVVVTGGMPKPFTYVDEKNELQGYDIDIVRAVFKELPQYDISIEKAEFTSIFAGLDSDRYQVGANNFAMNEERKQKYIYSDPIFKNQYVIAVAENRTDINSFKDLQGKTTECQPGVNYTTALENYNKKHSDKPVKITYDENDILPILQNVESGKFDFQLIDKAMLNNYIKEFGLKIKTIELSQEDSDLIGAPYSYLLISKGSLGEQLAKDINGALDKLIKDGTITEISKKYFNDDFSPK